MKSIGLEGEFSSNFRRLGPPTWTLRPFRGIIGTFKGTYEVCRRYMKIHTGSPYLGPMVSTLPFQRDVKLQVMFEGFDGWGLRLQMRLVQLGLALQLQVLIQLQG